MRHRLASILLLASIPALAQSRPFGRGIDLVPNKPTASQNSGILLDGAALPAAGSYRAAFVLDLSQGLLPFSEGEQRIGYLVPDRLDAHLIGAYSLLDWLEVGVDLPLTLTQGDDFQLLRDSGFPQDGISTSGLGDLRLFARGNPLPNLLPWGIKAALVAEVRAPTGDGESFLGDRAWVFAPRLALERAFGPVRLLVNLGLRLRLPAQYLNLYVSNEFTLGAGVVVRLPRVGPARPEALFETLLSTPLSEPFTFAQAAALKTPWEMVAGLRAHFGPRWGVDLDVGRGVGHEAFGREAFRFIAALRYDVEPAPAPPSARADPDHDLVVGLADLCPDVPGPVEYDGCPDSDGDQVPDNVDRCPHRAGPAEQDGCPEKGPEVEVENKRLRLHANILFDTGEATIQKQSYPVLDQIAHVLAEHPEILLVRVDGHTDNRGARIYNLNLSARRAQSVVNYLVRKGIDRKRLRAKGFGFSRPIASNATPLGRAKNRRVEFTILRRTASGKPHGK